MCIVLYVYMYIYVYVCIYTYTAIMHNSYLSMRIYFAQMIGCGVFAAEVPETLRRSFESVAQ